MTGKDSDTAPPGPGPEPPNDSSRRLDARIRSHLDAIAPVLEARLARFRPPPDGSVGPDDADAQDCGDELNARWRTTVAHAFSSEDPLLADISPHDLILLYEALLGCRPVRRHDRIVLTADRREPRRRGAFYTPRHLAERIVEETVGPALAEGTDPGTLRLLDPAAGGGVFLLAAARRLGPESVSGLVGLDRDAGALAVARLAFRRAFPGAPLPALLEADALLDDAPAGEPEDTRAAFEPASFHVVVGNPPFLNVKRGALRAVRDRLRARFSTARGQFDAWALFVELALDRLRPGGRLGLILPRPFLAAESYAAIRRRLLETSHLERVLELGQAFAGVGVEAVALVARKHATDRSRPRRLCFVDRADVVRSGPPSRSFLTLPHAAVSTACDSRDMVFLRAVEGAPERLGDWVTITRGLECGKRHPAVADETGTGRVPLLCGHQVDAFRAAPGSFLDLERVPERLQKPPELFRRKPKVLVRRVTDRLKAAVDRSGAFALNTLYVLDPGRDAGAQVCYVLVGLLNSAILSRYHRLAFASEDRLFPYVRKSQLMRLPVPSRAVWASPAAAELAALVRQAHAARGRVDRAAMDEIVAAWYGLRPDRIEPPAPSGHPAHGREADARVL